MAIRCLPVSNKRNSFVCYTQANHCPTVDFCATKESRAKKHKIKQLDLIRNCLSKQLLKIRKENAGLCMELIEGGLKPINILIYYIP